MKPRHDMYTRLRLQASGTLNFRIPESDRCGRLWQIVVVLMFCSYRACAINIMNIISSFAWISQFTPLGSHSWGSFTLLAAKHCLSWSPRSTVPVCKISASEAWGALATLKHCQQGVQGGQVSVCTMKTWPDNRLNRPNNRQVPSISSSPWEYTSVCGILWQMDQAQVAGCVWLLGQGKSEGLVRGRHLCSLHAFKDDHTLSANFRRLQMTSRILWFRFFWRVESNDVSRLQRDSESAVTQILISFFECFWCLEHPDFLFNAARLPVCQLL